MPSTGSRPRVVIYHRADYDGIFCREIARKFLGEENVTFIGWDYNDPVPDVPDQAALYMLDISVEGLMQHPGLIWIDHHKTAMEKYLPGFCGVQSYCIDGVAACRLAWQYFTSKTAPLPKKEDYIERRVDEPLAILMAGEHDVWDLRNQDNNLNFQFGLDAQQGINWERLFYRTDYVLDICSDGGAARRCYAKRDADMMRTRSFVADFEGLRFLCLNIARCNSITFEALDVPETGHDALMAFYFNGKVWRFSLYQAKHRTDIDLSTIAVKHGGGGHRGACGFQLEKLPWP